MLLRLTLKTQECAKKPTANFRWQNRKEPPNRSTNNGDMAETAKRPVSDRVGE